MTGPGRGLRGWRRPQAPEVDLGPAIDVGRFAPTAVHTGTLTVLMRGTHPDTGEAVALRFPRPDVEGAARALQAAVVVEQTVGAHPHLVPLLAWGGSGAQAVIVTPWYGSRLDAAGPGPFVIGQGALVAATLAVLHRGGIVHGDLGGEAVFLDAARRARLGGLHAARVPATGTQIPPRFPSAPLGPATAPEIVEGEAARPASDVYGLAFLLHQTLSGAAPVTSVAGEPEAALAARILTARRPALAPTQAPPDVADLVLRALSLDPSQRPSAGDLAQGLRLAALRAAADEAAATRAPSGDAEDQPTRPRRTGHRANLVLPVPPAARPQDEDTRRRP